MRKIGTTGVLMIACIVTVFGRQNMAEAQKKITVVEGILDGEISEGVVEDA